MNRLLTLVIALVCCIAAQAKHLEFMGIPITGSISTFQTKLQTKGCTLFKYNNQLQTGVRAFNGVFAGKDCYIIVFYNHKTKQVYQVRVGIECSSLDDAQGTFNFYANLLEQKYNEHLIIDLREESKEYDFGVFVCDPPRDENSKSGLIEMYINDDEESY